MLRLRSVASVCVSKISSLRQLLRVVGGRVVSLFELRIPSRVASRVLFVPVASRCQSEVAFVALGEAAARIVQSLSTKVEAAERTDAVRNDSHHHGKRF